MVGVGMEEALKNIHSHPLTTDRDIFHWNLTPKYRGWVCRRDWLRTVSSWIQVIWSTPSSNKSLSQEIKPPSRVTFQYWCKATNCWHQAWGGNETCNCLQDYFIFYIIIFIVLLYLSYYCIITSENKKKHQADDAVPAHRALPLETKG